MGKIHSNVVIFILIFIRVCLYTHTYMFSFHTDEVIWVKEILQAAFFCADSSKDYRSSTEQTECICTLLMLISVAISRAVLKEVFKVARPNPQELRQSKDGSDKQHLRILAIEYPL